MNAEITEALRCPFCGGPAAPQHLEWGVWMAGCANDDCSVCPEARAPSKAKAIRLWNTRAAIEALSANTVAPNDAEALKAAYIEGMVAGVSRGSVDAVSAQDAWETSRARGSLSANTVAPKRYVGSSDSGNFNVRRPAPVAPDDEGYCPKEEWRETPMGPTLVKPVYVKIDPALVKDDDPSGIVVMDDDAELLRLIAEQVLDGTVLSVNDAAHLKRIAERLASKPADGLRPLREALEVIAGGHVDRSDTGIIVGPGATTVMQQARASILTTSQGGCVMDAQILALLDKHIQRCRDAVAECPKWSPAQAEWSRARDALLNFKDDLAALSPDGENHD